MQLTNKVNKEIDMTPVNIAGESYWNAKQAGAFLLCSPNWVMLEARKGKIKRLRRCRCVWFKKEWLIEYNTAQQETQKKRGC